MTSRPGQWALQGLFLCVFSISLMLAPIRVAAAPYAAMVMDARTGEVLHSRNADTQLHPASLTKMMTLYVAFQAIERGEIIAFIHALESTPGKHPRQATAPRFLPRARTTTTGGPQQIAFRSGTRQRNILTRNAQRLDCTVPRGRTTTTGHNG